MKRALKIVIMVIAVLSTLTGIVFAEIQIDGKGTINFYSSKAQKSQIQFAAGLIKIDYAKRFSSLKNKTDIMNKECEKLDNGGALNEKKLKAQFESIIASSKALRKDIAKIKAEDARMKNAKNMLINGFEFLESAMEDLRKVTVTKDFSIFESYRIKVDRANMFYKEGWAIIIDGL